MYTSIKEYASSRGISYEVVRRQMKRYANELEKFTTKQGRQTYLNDQGVEFLDQHRAPKTLVVEYPDNELKDEIERLRAQIEHYRDTIDRLNATIIEKDKEQSQLIEDKTRYQTLLEIRDNEHAQLEQAQKELTESRSDLKHTALELENVKAELKEKADEVGRFKKTLFGLYRRS
jgi:chromosome segregation ATPase